MVQPKYSPEEALKRIKLMMEYDSSKTLTENEKVISEQYVAPAVAGTAAAATLGAGYGAAASAGALGGLGTGAAGASLGLGTALAPTLGAAGATALGASVIAGAAGLALLPLAYWLITKDTGANKVKKMFEMCSSDAAKIAKLERKLQDVVLRDITDDIEDAINDTTFGIAGGTNEEKLFGAFKKLQDGTASDFCALVKYYNSHSDSGDLFDDLDSDIDAESEWKQIYRPIRNCVEDSLMSLKDDTVVTASGKSDGKSRVNTGGYNGGGYLPCTGTYKYKCKSDAIAKVQGCLGLVADGKFGPKTKAALAEKGYSTFVDSDVDKICNKQPQKPKEDVVQVDADSTDDIFNS
jgi:hypothetical protein